MKRGVLVLFLFVSCVFGQIEILWGQSDKQTTRGAMSATFLNGTNKVTGSYPGTIQVADDFDVPLNEAWSVQQVAINGFFYTVAMPVAYWTLQIYGSILSGGYLLPGALLYELKSLYGINAPSPAFSLSTPLGLSSGKYWVSAFPALYSNGTVPPSYYCYLRNTTGGRFHNSSSITLRDNSGVISLQLANIWLNKQQLGTTFEGTDDSIFSIVGVRGAATTGQATTAIPTTAVPTTGVATTGVATTGLSCRVGSLECACTRGGGCDLGLICLGGETCIIPLTTGTPVDHISSNNSSDKPANVLGIVLGTLGGILLIILIVAAILVIILMRRRATAAQPTKAASEMQLVPIEKKTGYDTIPVTPGSSSQPNPLIGGGSVRNSALPQIPDSNNDFEIDYSELEFENEVGRGSYGVVFKGRWRGGTVAIKQLLLRNALSPKELSEFKGEAAVMKRLRPHVNVVQFLGITSSPQLCIVTEFLDQGSLFSFIFSDAKIDTNILMNISKGIAAGMLHLHKEGIVHRDLATRNILLGAGFQVKISDFGLSRAANTEDKQSNQTRSDTGPLKWMSPEAIRNREYSTMSDIWAFGVTLYEIVARSEPYSGLDAVQTALEVTHSGLRLEIPKYTPLILAEVMQGCLLTDPSQRPNFQQISKMFQEAKLDMWMIR